jgi:hypothetical protein
MRSTRTHEDIASNVPPLTDQRRPTSIRSGWTCRHCQVKDDPVSGPTAFWQEESVAITESQAGFGSACLTARRLASFVRASSEVEEESAADLERVSGPKIRLGLRDQGRPGWPLRRRHEHLWRLPTAARPLARRPHNRRAHDRAHRQGSMNAREARDSVRSSRRRCLARHSR